MPMYQFIINADFDDNDVEARGTLRKLVDAVSGDNDFYEFNTKIVNLDTNERVSIYDDSYPIELRQNPETD